MPDYTGAEATEASVTPVQQSVPGSDPGRSIAYSRRGGRGRLDNTFSSAFTMQSNRCIGRRFTGAVAGWDSSAFALRRDLIPVRSHLAIARVKPCEGEGGWRREWDSNPR
jgi:hypothetical protein